MLKKKRQTSTLCPARNLPGTSGPWNFRPPSTSTTPGVPTFCLARNLPGTWPRTSAPLNLRPCPELPAPGSQPCLTCANFRLRPDPARNLRRPELPALPARSHLGRGPCTLSPLRLYILIHPVRFRVSIGLAHICVRAFAHPLGYFSTEIRTSSEKIPQADSRPLSRQDHQGLHEEKNCPLYPYLFVDCGSYVSLCVR